MNQRRRAGVSSSSTSETVTISPNGTVSSGWAVSSDSVAGHYRGSRTKQESIEAAVYAHIQAMLALGHTRLNSLTVARALSLPIADVEEAMRNLADKGIRIIE